MTEETPDQTRIEEQAAEQVEEKPLEQPHFDPEAEKKPTEGVKTEEKPEVNQEEKEKVKKEEMKQDERSAELKKAEANPEYMGNEMGEDILSIPLDDPVANAAASKIQAFHGTTFRAYSLEIVKPQPTVKEVPKIILEEKPKTKWFRDPKTGYWVQVQKPTSVTWGVVGEFRKKVMFY